MRSQHQIKKLDPHPEVPLDHFFQKSVRQLVRLPTPQRRGVNGAELAEQRCGGDGGDWSSQDIELHGEKTPEVFRVLENSRDCCM